ncbi:hypothetical protein ACWIUD_05050 [Helicobacter sp. 23-1044]
MRKLPTPLIPLRKGGGKIAESSAREGEQNRDSANFGESKNICHIERSEISQKSQSKRDSSLTLFAQNDNFFCGLPRMDFVHSRNDGLFYPPP